MSTICRRCSGNPISARMRCCYLFVFFCFLVGWFCIRCLSVYHINSKHVIGPRLRAHLSRSCALSTSNQNHLDRNLFIDPRRSSRLHSIRSVDSDSVTSRKGSSHPNTHKKRQSEKRNHKTCVAHYNRAAAASVL